MATATRMNPAAELPMTALIVTVPRVVSQMNRRKRSTLPSPEPFGGRREGEVVEPSQEDGGDE